MIGRRTDVGVEDVLRGSLENSLSDSRGAARNTQRVHDELNANFNWPRDVTSSQDRGDR
jgi:hypothetical protein